MSKALTRKKLNEIHHGNAITNIREIREWRSKVTQVRIFRSKGYCELCLRYYGVRNGALKGHHALSPTQCKIGCKYDFMNSEENIVICCYDCYKNKVLSGDLKWLDEWEKNKKELKYY
jgi:hypothetical protein